MSDMTDRFSGRAKELMGKATHNKKLELKGKLQRDMAELRKKAKDASQQYSQKLYD
jgi:uncharacterized protein YjbJ (UPF0337 family)